MKKISLFTLSFLVPFYAEAAAQIAASPVNYGANLMQMLLGLFAIIAMIVGLVWLLKKIGYKGYAGSDVMKIKSCLPLSTKEKLMLVEVGGEQLLIGVAPGFVGHIKTLNTNIEEKQKESIPSLFSEKIKAIINQDQAVK